MHTNLHETYPSGRARVCLCRTRLFLSLGNPMELLELQTKTGAGPNRTTWEKVFFTSGSATQMKMDENQLDS